MIACAAVLCPSLSTLAAMGLYSLCGGPLNYIMRVTVLLVLGIGEAYFGQRLAYTQNDAGVDDAFLLMHAWHNVQTEFTQHSDGLNTDASQEESKLGLAFESVAKSMVITSVTNSLAFALGSFTTTIPFLHNWCIVTCKSLPVRALAYHATAAAAIAMMFDLIFEVTYFASGLVIFAGGTSSEPSDKTQLEQGQFFSH